VLANATDFQAAGLDEQMADLQFSPMIAGNKMAWKKQIIVKDKMFHANNLQV
jgi:hypothetical protein